MDEEEMLEIQKMIFARMICKLKIKGPLFPFPDDIEKDMTA